MDESSAESVQAASGFNQYSRFFSVPITISLEAPNEFMLRGGEQLSFTSPPNGGFSVGITGTRWGTVSGVSGERNSLFTAGHSFINWPIGTPIFNRNGVEIGNLAMYTVGHHRLGTSMDHGDWALIDLNSFGSVLIDFFRNLFRVCVQPRNRPVVVRLRGCKRIDSKEV